MFDEQAMKRCHQVLCEVLATLSDVAAEIYLVGGWAVYFILFGPDSPVRRLRYAGTLDVDVALALQLGQREGVLGRFLSKGYVRDKRIADRLLRGFPDGAEVAVDFLRGDKEILQGLTYHIPVVGETPEGETFKGSVAVVDLEACLAMKAIAFDRDPKPKDAYDIYYLVTHGKDEQGDCADHVKAKLDFPLIRRGVEALEIHFGRLGGRGLRRAMQLLRDFDGMDARTARAAVRGSLRSFFRKLGKDVSY